MKRLFALFALALLLPMSAHAWWNEDWTVRKKITLDTQAAALNAELTDLPVLVRLSTAGFDFLSAKEDGSDLRFVAEDDKTVLAHRIERFDSLNELAFVWVRVPRVAAGNAAQHVWLYYGNDAAPAPQAMPVYDPAQWAVWSMAEDSGLPQDSASAANHVSGGTVSFEPAGLIGGSARLAGDGGLQAGAPSLAAASGFTLSAWIKPEQIDGQLLAYGGLTLALAQGTPVATVGAARAAAPTPLSLNAWHHIALGWDAAALTLYVNGQPVATAAAPFAAAPALTLGGGLVGEIDEVQLSTVARPAAWVAALADNQGMATRLVRQGEEESTEGGAETGYFMATMNNLTVDGWVVTIICLLMLFVALYVMWAKAMLLSRVEKSNPRFNEAFQQLSAQLRTLNASAKEHASRLDGLAAQAQQHRHSPLMRIYEVGARELKSRFHLGDANTATVQHDGVVAPSVSERAMLAVRAALDAQMTRERARLDSGMVLLTIAISGGPFLGLLGTVVGVMITFAAIAAAGDVNVNAIAPGIAAALVATVAGLGVAIPALFGYNYLQTKIKTLSNDMTVFVDEFVTRMAETYGD
jgi:biopolymer transport protein ExbB